MNPQDPLNQPQEGQGYQPQAQPQVEPSQPGFTAPVGRPQDPQQVYSPEQTPASAIPTSNIPPQQPLQPQPFAGPSPQPIGGPPAPGVPGQDYYSQGKASPLLGILALVFSITFFLAPVGFILSIASIVKGVKSKTTSLLVMGVAALIIGVIASIFWIALVVSTYFGILLKANAPDYSSTSQKTYTKSEGKISVAVPEKYSIESEGSTGGSDSIDIKIFSNKKVEVGADDSKGMLGKARGGVFVAVDKYEASSYLTVDQIKSALETQPDFVNSIKTSFEESFTAGLSSSCDDKPTKSSSADMIENKYFDIKLKFTCTLKDADEKYTTIMKVRVSMTDGKIYMAGSMEPDSLYAEQSSDIEEAINGAKFE